MVVAAFDTVDVDFGGAEYTLGLVTDRFPPAVPLFKPKGLPAV